MSASHTENLINTQDILNCAEIKQEDDAIIKSESVNEVDSPNTKHEEVEVKDECTDIQDSDQPLQVNSTLTTRKASKGLLEHECTPDEPSLSLDVKEKPFIRILYDFKANRKSNPQEKSFTCYSCNHKTNNKNSLRIHLRTHRDEKLFTCNLCTYKSNQKGNLQAHIRTHTGEKPFACNFCSYKTNKKGGLQKHMVIHTGEKRFACNLCDYKSAHKSSVQTHILTHTGEKSFVCNLCNYKTSQRASLQKHMLTHTGQKPFACSLCEYRANHKSSLRIHMYNHTGEKLFACNLCDYKTNNKNNLRVHILNHTDEKLFSCTLCNYKCNQKASLQSHMLTHTGEKPFACNFCDYKGNKKDSLQKHMLIHTEEKLFACVLCNYKTNYKNNFRTHMRNHTGEKPFACNLCSYKTNDKGSLPKHILTHSKDKPYACNLCNYKAYQAGHLRRHVYKHTGEKPFACNLCNYKVKQKISLRAHMFTHTGEKPLACDLCTFRTCYKRSLQKHVQVVHNTPFAGGAATANEEVVGVFQGSENGVHYIRPPDPSAFATNLFSTHSNGLQTQIILPNRVPCVQPSDSQKTLQIQVANPTHSIVLMPQIVQLQPSTYQISQIPIQTMLTTAYNPNQEGPNGMTVVAALQPQIMQLVQHHTENDKADKDMGVIPAAIIKNEADKDDCSSEAGTSIAASNHLQNTAVQEYLQRIPNTALPVEFNTDSVVKHEHDEQLTLMMNDLKSELKIEENVDDAEKALSY